jgi:hypothetical protein
MAHFMLIDSQRLDTKLCLFWALKVGSQGVRNRDIDARLNKGSLAAFG